MILATMLAALAVDVEDSRHSRARAHQIKGRLGLAQAHRKTTVQDRLDWAAKHISAEAAEGIAALLKREGIDLDTTQPFQKYISWMVEQAEGARVAGDPRWLPISDLDLILEWLAWEQPDVSKTTRPAASQKARVWAESVKMGGRAKTVGKIVMRFSDGYTVQQIYTDKELREEGESMNHCIGGREYRNKSGDDRVWRYYSLRSPANRPVATMEYNVQGRRFPQIKGRGNVLPHEKYLPKIADFALSLSSFESILREHRKLIPYLPKEKLLELYVTLKFELRQGTSSIPTHLFRPILAALPEQSRDPWMAKYLEEELPKHLGMVKLADGDGYKFHPIPSSGTTRDVSMLQLAKMFGPALRAGAGQRIVDDFYADPQAASFQPALHSHALSIASPEAVAAYLNDYTRRQLHRADPPGSLTKELLSEVRKVSKARPDAVELFDIYKVALTSPANAMALGMMDKGTEMLMEADNLSGELNRLSMDLDRMSISTKRVSEFARPIAKALIENINTRTAPAVAMALSGHTVGWLESFHAHSNDRLSSNIYVQMRPRHYAQIRALLGDATPPQLYRRFNTLIGGMTSQQINGMTGDEDLAWRLRHVIAGAYDEADADIAEDPEISQKTFSSSNLLRLSAVLSYPYGHDALMQDRDLGARSLPSVEELLAQAKELEGRSRTHKLTREKAEHFLKVVREARHQVERMGKHPVSLVISYDCTDAPSKDPAGDYRHRATVLTVRNGRVHMERKSIGYPHLSKKAVWNESTYSWDGQARRHRVLVAVRAQDHGGHFRGHPDGIVVRAWADRTSHRGSVTYIELEMPWDARERQRILDEGGWL